MLQHIPHGHLFLEGTDIFHKSFSPKRCSITSFGFLQHIIACDLIRAASRYTIFVSVKKSVKNLHASIIASYYLHVPVCIPAAYPRVPAQCDIIVVIYIILIYNLYRTNRLSVVPANIIHCCCSTRRR